MGKAGRTPRVWSLCVHTRVQTGATVCQSEGHGLRREGVDTCSPDPEVSVSHLVDTRIVCKRRAIPALA